MNFSLHCDISFDGTSNVKGVPHVPKTYVFAGFFADDLTCETIEKKWKQVNDKYEVPRFHAAHLNVKHYEYEGWDDERKEAYSAELLNILKAEGKRVYAVSCGIFADDYKRIISDKGQRKMGSPYLVCFNSCITLVAQSMNAPGAFADKDCFSVVLDPDAGYKDAIDSFSRMKENPLFRHRNRLGMCALSTMEDTVCLQAADLIAYELFKRLHSKRKGVDSIRYPLQSMMRDNVVSERFFGSNTLERMKEEIENTPSIDGGLIIIPKS